MDYIDAARPIIEDVFSRELGVQSIVRNYKQLVPQVMSFLKGLPHLLLSRSS